MQKNPLICIIVSIIYTLQVSADGPIAAYGEQSLVLKEDGTVWGTGSNNKGQLGDATTTNRNTFAKAKDISGVKAIAAGKEHSLVLKSDGTVWGTGLNDKGQLGDGTTTDRNTFVKAKDMSGFDGGRDCGCKSGSFCNYDSGDKGGCEACLGSAHECGNAGLPQKGVTDCINRCTKATAQGVRAISAGDAHTMVVKADGTVWGTGSNRYGQLADATSTDKKTFSPAWGATGFSAISAGSFHTLALKPDGTVHWAGRNKYGEIGTSDGGWGASNHFQKADGISGARAIAAGSYYSLVLKKDGTLWGTGLNDKGQLGDGTTTSRKTFVKAKISDVVAIACGSSHTIALKADGTVWGVGVNNKGQLGDGTNTNKNVFVKATGISGVRALAAGLAYSLVVKADNTVWGTGSNDKGQLGDGTATDRNVFVKAKAILG